jgi:glycerol-3-phosphate dehydrogenase (NAD(P)+)
MPSTPDPSPPQIGIAGLTAWGLGLALTLARAGRQILLVARNAGEADALELSRRHRRLPGVELPANVDVRCASRAELENLEALILAVPSQLMRENLRLLAPHLNPATAIISAAKGLEQETQLRMTQVIDEELCPERPPSAFSGPNLVAEIVAGLPAAAVHESGRGGR